VWGIDVAHAKDPHGERSIKVGCARKLPPVNGTEARLEPEVSVVVPSHERPLRLRWLLNALEEQTLEPSRFEVVVAHDSRDEVAEMIDRHPLALAGVLAQRRLEPGTGTPARHRNLGWRSAQAPLIAFTDDDCRPESDWLETLLAAGLRHPGAIVQGTTRPDPNESDLLKATHARTQDITPPAIFAQTCNILYPRELLERLDGFDELVPTASGEDTDLAIRARNRGTAYLAEPEAVVNHAVESLSLRTMLKLSWRWRHLPLVTKRHPVVREEYLLGRFWKPTHLTLPLALLGFGLSRRTPLAAGLAVPYLRETLARHGTHKRGRLMAAAALPGRVAIDTVEIAALSWGSIRYRTLFV
jgi:GT2 family glycosyltransferase